MLKIIPYFVSPEISVNYLVLHVINDYFNLSIVLVHAVMWDESHGSISMEHHRKGKGYKLSTKDDFYSKRLFLLKLILKLRNIMSEMIVDQFWVFIVKYHIHHSFRKSRLKNQSDN